MTSVDRLTPTTVITDDNDVERETRYLELVARRKTCNRCSRHLTNASSIDEGRFDCDELGAFSRWQGNLHAELMVVGQDFADDKRFCVCEGWPDERAVTNLFLVELLAEAGVTIRAPHKGTADDRVFFTNAVLCMGRKGSTIPVSCFRACGAKFLRPTIEIVSSRVVVTLGAMALEAVNRAFDLAPPAELPVCGGLPRPTPIRGQFISTVLTPVYHPSPRVQNTTRSREAQRADWREVGRVLAGLRMAA